jgi:hypothetical protein
MLTALTLALTASLTQEKKQPPTAPPHKLKAIASWVAPCMGVTLEGRV